MKNNRKKKKRDNVEIKILFKICNSFLNEEKGDIASIKHDQGVT